MKKITLTIGCAIALIVNTFAQGTVQWSGAGPSLVVQTNSTVYSTFIGFGSGATGFGSQGNTLGNTAANDAALGFQGYRYALLVSSNAVTAPTTIASLLLWSDTGLMATNSVASNGRIVQMADDGVANNTQATANNWLGGTTESVILVGWSANLGSTYASVLNQLQNWGVDGIGNAYFGVSSMGTLASGTGNPGVIVFGGGGGQINNGPLNSPSGTPMQLDLIPTPEPGTMGLALFGAASLLLFRRRK